MHSMHSVLWQLSCFRRQLAQHNLLLALLLLFRRQVALLALLWHLVADSPKDPRPSESVAGNRTRCCHTEPCRLENFRTWTCVGLMETEARMQGARSKRKREREEASAQDTTCAGADDSGEAAASSASADAIRSADRTSQGVFAWRKSGALPCDVWQAFGLAQRGDRVGLVSTPAHRGVTAIIKEVHLNSHWPSRLCVTLERCGEELDDILRSDVVLLSASSSALGPAELITPRCGKLGGPKKDLLGENLDEGAETQLAMSAEANSRCKNAETSTVSLSTGALWVIILADNDPRFRIAPAFPTT